MIVPLQVGALKIKLDICNRFKREALKIENKKRKTRINNLKKDSKIVGALKIKLDICNRFK